MSAKRRWTVVALGALTIAWTVAPATVPLYDGLQNPDEPYRWVHPPAEAKHTPPPTLAIATLTAKGGRSLDAGYANSGESGPQISWYVPALAFAVPTTATTVTLKAEPLAPSPPEPTDGRILTNVYRLTATTAAGPATLDSYGHDQPTLQMRAPTGRQPGPVFEHRTPTGWQRAQTIRVAYDVYQAQVSALGDWALVQLTSNPAAPNGGPGINWALLGAGLALLAIAGLVVAIRTHRTGSDTEPSEPLMRRQRAGMTQQAANSDHVSERDRSQDREPP